MSSFYKTYSFEIELQSGKLEIYETQAMNWKEAWGRLGDWCRFELDEDDSVINVGLANVT